MQRFAPVLCNSNGPADNNRKSTILKIHVGKPSKSPFEVPEGKYLGTFFRYRVPKKLFCARHKLEDQIVFDFALVDSEGADEGYIAWIQLCTKCKHGHPGIGNFLEGWLGDRYYDLLDENGDIDLDALIRKKADLQIVHKQKPGYAGPCSCIAQALPPGTLID